MKKILCTISFCFIVFSIVGQTGKILYATKDGKVLLRWMGIYNVEIGGYNVYRKTAVGNWEKISSSPVKPILDYNELKPILGFKTDAYLQLFGVSGERKQSITRLNWDSAFAKPEAGSFIGAMSIINPEYARALGEFFEDSPPDRTIVYSYKVTWLNTAGIESDLAMIASVNAAVSDVVPEVAELNAIPGNGKIRLEWKKDKELMKSGKVVTYRVYKSSDILGPYEQVNYYGLLSISVQSGNKTTNENIESYGVDFLENGKPYYFKVKAVNAFDMESPAGITVSAKPEDPASLAPPESVKISISGTLAKMTWEGKKRVAVFRTEIQRNKGFVQVYPPKGAILAENNVWFDNNIQQGHAYWYTLRTIDKEGNFGSFGDTVYLNVPDITPPLAPLNVTAKTGAKRGLILISWDANKEPDILGYEVERASDKSLLSRFLLTSKPVTVNTFKDTLNYLAQTTFGYVIYSIDKNYNRSAPSKMATIRLPDFEAPAKPLILKMTETDSGVRIDWEGPPDKDIASFTVFRKVAGTAQWGTAIAKTAGLNYLDKISAGTYSYAVAAVDSSANTSELSIPQSIIVKADNSLKMPISGRADTASGSVLLSWQTAAGATPAGWVITRLINGQRMDIAELDALVTNYEDQYPVNGKIIYEIRARNSEWQMGFPLIIEIDFKQK